MRGFVYKSKGQMAIIGKRTGIASILGINIAGFWAWFLWRSIYLRKIPTAEKRFRVMLDWTVDLLFDRDITRLKILGKDDAREYQDLDEVDDLW
jgi:NADH dehydrogenase